MKDSAAVNGVWKNIKAYVSEGNRNVEKTQSILSKQEFLNIRHFKNENIWWIWVLFCKTFFKTIMFEIF